LDADPWLLNVANGTIDLRTGVLRPHDPRDLLTKLADVAYDPAAKCPMWDRFLDRVMGGSVELVDYLARMVGYSLTGVIREHVLAFLFGGGANGKSTFLRVLHALLGDHAARASRGLLFASRGERHPTELTILHGARVATCAEIQAGDYFDEALVKDLTGGDLIAARRMREDFWTFAPTHKLWLAGNHKPRVRGDDEGIWRRIRLVPWTVTIPTEERDPELVDKLLAELPGILAWAVRGCLAWQRSGLGDPPEVTRATANYREEADPLREFCDGWLVFGPDERAARKHIRAAYEEYCRDDGAEPLGARRFADGLRRRGVTDTSVRAGMKVLDGWRGVRLATDVEREAVGCRGDAGGDSRFVSSRAQFSTITPSRDTTAPYDDPDERAAIEAESSRGEGES
ncbi:MAG: hypothetical protein JNL38_22995, partial [Myxococcales bacterium]|nr:hypothetical protein [Myxococcales bacterium]